MPDPALGECWVPAAVRYCKAEHLATNAPAADWYPASNYIQGINFMVFGDPDLRPPGRLPLT